MCRQVRCFDVVPVLFGTSAGVQVIGSPGCQSA